jgi:hypothetical protein
MSRLTICMIMYHDEPDTDLELPTLVSKAFGYLSLCALASIPCSSNQTRGPNLRRWFAHVMLADRMRVSLHQRPNHFEGRLGLF